MRHSRAILILVGFLSLTLLLMPLQLLLLACSTHWSRQLPWYYHRILVRLLGITVDIEGQMPAAPTLLVSNHVSWLDIPILSSVTPLSFIAKREVASWPLFGWMAKLQRSIFINRESRSSIVHFSQMIKARFLLSDSLVLFPEGTSGDGKTVKPFKSSYFGVADNQSVAVIPISIIYLTHYGIPLTQRRRPSFAWYGDMELVPHLWSSLKAGPLGVKIIIHPELPKRGRKQTSAMAENIIRNGLVEALHGKPEIR